MAEQDLKIRVLCVAITVCSILSSKIITSAADWRILAVVIPVMFSGIVYLKITETKKSRPLIWGGVVILFLVCMSYREHIDKKSAIACIIIAYILSAIATWELLSPTNNSPPQEKN